MIYDPEQDSYEWSENDLINASGVGPKVVQMLVKKNVNVFIVPHVGDNARYTIKAASAKIFKAKGKDLREMIENYKAKKLEEMG